MLHITFILLLLLLLHIIIIKIDGIILRSFTILFHSLSYSNTVNVLHNEYVIRMSMITGLLIEVVCMINYRSYML
jgi:hypothetical protein